MQSVSSGAVAGLLNTNLDDNSIVDISSQVTKHWGISTVKAIRRNNVVQLYLSGTYSGNATYSTQTLLEGLPEKYRPLADTLCSFAVVSHYTASSPYVRPSRMTLNSNGIIYLAETSMPNGASMTFGVTYIGKNI